MKSASSRSCACGFWPPLLGVEQPKLRTQLIREQLHNVLLCAVDRFEIEGKQIEIWRRHCTVKECIDGLKEFALLWNAGREQKGGTATESSSNACGFVIKASV